MGRIKYVVLGAQGEFGLKVYHHAPTVHALDGPKVVYHEKGEEALFPSADRLIELPRIEDDKRAGTFPRSEAQTLARYRSFASQRWPKAEIIQTDPSMPQERFVPEPHVIQGIGPLDIVVCPRWRDYGSQKNWSAWRSLTERLQDAGWTVAAAGAPDSSLPVPCYERAWEYDRFLDASIEMMGKAKLVVATDAGLAHLAVLCGVDLLVVTYRGRVAPGPVVDSQGNVARGEYWRAGWGPNEREDRFKAANHMGARIEYVDGWEDVDKVVEAVENW